ncbi:hypothetical protein ABAC460_03820 [Asticcacaulis sp. AC460]|uniref:beta-xylosidase family glycoside hydrolase n=1 Tax=Asticcacaulis sp. AC460 TaxID=1282360 RepID=UPI0003C3DAE5|nr:hypothetical protein [Asticcacaulis sp. AC460]ESQ92038.1 hypothetical protein ABAC460_03820 [Asticcacaulis sp. AC460]
MMTFKRLLLLTLSAATLSGCTAAVVAPVLAPLVAFPPSLQGDDSPKITDAVSPVPGEAVFYNITYEEHGARFSAQDSAAGVNKARLVSVYGAEDDYAATWQSIGAPETFLTVQDLDLTYPDGSIGKRRIVRLKATAQSPGVEGANPSFTGIKQAWPRANYTTRVIYSPQQDGDRAGILAWQDNQHYVFCGAAQLNGKPAAVLARRESGDEPDEGLMQATYPLDAKSLTDLGLLIEIQDGRLSCFFSTPKLGRTLVGTVNVQADQRVLIGAHAFSPAP